MSNFTDLQQGIEAVTEKLSELDDQHSKSKEYMLCVINEVEDRVRQCQAEMTQNRTEHERIMREYEQARRLLHSLELLTLKASSYSYPTGVFRDLDANAWAPDSVANGNREVADPGAVPDEDYAEVDPDHLRLGLKRALKKNGNGVSKGGSSASAADPYSASFRARSTL